MDGTYCLLKAEGVDYKRAKKVKTLVFADGRTDTYHKYRGDKAAFVAVLEALLRVHGLVDEMATELRRKCGIIDDAAEKTKRAMARVKLGLPPVDYSVIMPWE